MCANGIIALRLGCIFAAIVACTICRAQYRQQYPLPTARVPDALGVNIHFTDPKPGEMEQLAGAGFHWARMDFGWAGIEHVKGQYDFAAFDRLLSALKPRHIRPIFILDYGNDLYEKGAPRSPEARQAFVNFVKAGVTHFRHQGVLWEMWNEPNGQFWLPRANVDEYITLAKAVGKAIRETAPDEWYIGPAVSGMDFAFLERCFQAGLLNYWDAVSFHPYRNMPPETVAQDYAHLRQILAQYEGKEKREEGKEAHPTPNVQCPTPLISGEWGYSEKYPGLSLELQSKYIVREYLTNLANDVPLSIWYDWHDDGTDPKEVEHHFGTVFNDYKPKTTYLAAQTLATQLQGYTFNKRLSLDSSDDYCLLFSKGDKVRLVAWIMDANHKAHEVTLPTSAGGFDVVDYLGGKSTVAATQSGLKVTLTDAPQYILPRRANDLLTIAAQLPPIKPAMIGTGPWKLYEISRASQPMLFRYAPHFLQSKGGRMEVRLEPASADILDENLWLSATKLFQPNKMSYTTVLTSRSEAGTIARTTLRLPGLPTIAQETRLLPRNPLRVVTQPTEGKTIQVRVENPTGVAWKGTILNREQGSAQPIAFTQGQKEQTVTLPVKTGARNSTAQIVVREIPRGTGSKPVVVLETPRLQYTLFESFEGPRSVEKPLFTTVLDGSPTVSATCNSYLSKSKQNEPVQQSFIAHLEYKFDPGWKFLRIVPKRQKQEPLPGKPYALGMWIKSDGSGDALRMRFTDATGQTFQPDAGLLDWKGWRYVEFPLQGKIDGRWGGAEDGIIHYPIHIDTMLLVDSPGGRGGTGKISVAGVTLIEKVK